MDGLSDAKERKTETKKQDRGRPDRKEEKEKTERDRGRDKVNIVWLSILKSLNILQAFIRNRSWHQFSSWIKSTCTPVGCNNIPQGSQHRWDTTASGMQTCGICLSSGSHFPAEIFSACQKYWFSHSVPCVSVSSVCLHALSVCWPALWLFSASKDCSWLHWSKMGAKRFLPVGNGRKCERHERNLVQILRVV